MQRVTTSSLTEAFPKLSAGRTKVSRLYQPYDPKNPTPSKLHQKYPIPRAKHPKAQSIDHAFQVSSSFHPIKTKTNNIPHKLIEEEIKIYINTVESLPQPENPTNPVLPITEISTNNSSFDSNRASSLNSSSKSAGLEPKKQRKTGGKPARFLTPYDCEEITKPKNKREEGKSVNIRKRRESIEFMTKVLENDKKEFKNELNLRKNRKHKVVRLMQVRVDEGWGWSSPEVSPVHRVKFFES